MSSEDIIKFIDVHKYFGEKKVLRGLNFSIKKGSVAVVMGPSGTGKSTVIKLMVGLLKPTKGKVIVAGQDVAKLDKKGLRELRKKIGFAFQFGALFDSMTIFDNVAFPLREHTKLSEKEIEKEVRDAISLVGLSPDDVLKLYPDELSGGMQKRAAIARTIILKPEIILYDEPTSGLDPIASDLISRLIVKLQKELGTTSVVISHDIKESFKIADQMIMLYHGKVLAAREPEFFRESHNPVIEEFIEGIATL